MAKYKMVYKNCPDREYEADNLEALFNHIKLSLEHDAAKEVTIKKVS